MATRPTRQHCMASFVPCSLLKATTMRYVCLFRYDGTFDFNNEVCFTVLSFVSAFFPVSQAYRWCIEAMKEITPGLPVKVVVDVLRQASKVTFTLLGLCCLCRIHTSANQHFVLLSKEILWVRHDEVDFDFLCAAGLCGEERVQKSRAADQTCSVSSKVTCCVS